jgi:Zn-dependent protease with chaperone function
MSEGSETGAAAASDPASEPSVISAIYYDGTSSRKRAVTLAPGDGLDILEGGTTIARWPYRDIRRADGGRALRLSCVSALPLSRIEIADKAQALQVLALCPSLDEGHNSKQTGKIVAWSVAAACSIVLVILFGIPLLADRLAPLVPYAVEKRIGDAVDRQAKAILGGRVCDNKAGQAALEMMVEKIRVAGGMTSPLEAQVLSTSIPNAFALPGGKVYLLDGLIQQARSVDEVAGVLAHELGHAHHRDGLRKLIQTGGSSFLIGLLFGDVTGGGAVLFAARSMIDASYSREAESQADGFAIDSMNTLGRSPKPLGEFLVRITGKSRISTVIDSHPLSADRLDRMQREDRGTRGAPILTEAQWQDLRRICADPGNDTGKEKSKDAGGGRR